MRHSVIVKPRVAEVQRCPYLGLHDDPSTALAYPSSWNYCYHATPAAPVAASHQAEVCLCPLHGNCVVYLTGKTDPLPASLRGKASRRQRYYFSKKSDRRILFLPLAAILLLVVLFLMLRSPLLREDRRILSLPGVSALLPLVTTQGRTPAGIAPVASQMPVTASSTPDAAPDLPTEEIALDSVLPSRSPAQKCGHELDVPFGKPVRFVLHRVLLGDSVALYAGRYETSTEAIMAVNYQLPVPLRPDWIVVIPVGTTGVYGLPPFETYHAPGMRLLADELAARLDSDVESIDKYNAFKGPCTVFSGWLLVPRETATP